MSKLVASAPPNFLESFTMKQAIVVLCILVASVSASAKEGTDPLAEFASDAATQAVKKYRERLAFLDMRLAAEIEEAQATLKVDLQDAMRTAVMADDLAETERLSRFLQGDYLERSLAGDELLKKVIAGDAQVETDPRDPEEVRNRLDAQLVAAKAQAIADFEQMAKKAVAQGKHDRASEIWEEVFALDPTHEEASGFFKLLGRKKIPLPENDARTFWQLDDEPDTGYMKTRDGWVHITQGKQDKKLQEVERTAHTIMLRAGNDTYRLHRDSLYGRGGDSKWYFHGNGRWAR